MKRVILRTGIVFVIGLAAAFVFSKAHIVAASADLPRFTVISSKRFIDPSGKTVGSVLIIHGAESDGSYATTTTTTVYANGGSQSGTIRSVVNLSAKQRIVVHPLSHSTTSYQLDDSMLAHYRHNRGVENCEAPANSTVGTILGYRVIKVESHTENSEMRLESETWVAPALNCYALGQTVKVYSTDGKPKATNVLETESVMAGEVDPALFQIPAGYTERPPSKVMELDRTLRGSPACSECERKSAMTSDEVYNKSHR